MPVLRRRSHVKRYANLAGVRKTKLDRDLFTRREGLFNAGEHEMTSPWRQRHLIVRTDRQRGDCAHSHHRPLHRHFVYVHVFSARALCTDKLVVGVSAVDDGEIARRDIDAARGGRSPSVFDVQACALCANAGWRLLIVLRLRAPAGEQARQKYESPKRSHRRSCAARAHGAHSGRFAAHARFRRPQLSGPVLSKKSA